MDNFMDKLAKRFNAGELIAANGEAEARENQRLKEQTQEYDKIMQEIRRLNLKTIEISEQVSQMVACGIEQFEAYAAQDSGKQQEQDTAMSSVAEEMSTRMIEKLNRLEEATTDIDIALDKVAQKSGNAAEHYGQFIEKTGQMENSIGRMLEKSNRLEEATSDVEAAVGLVTDKAAKMEKALIGVTDRTEQMEASISRVTEASAHMQESLGQVEASANRLQYEVEESRRTMESAFGNLEQVLAEELGGDEEEKQKLEQILSDLASHSEMQQESAKQIKEMIVNIRLYLDEVQKHIEDAVHKEDVKVYRNVQAVLMEQLSAKTRDIGDRLDKIEKQLDKNKGNKGLMVFLIILTFASIALQVVQMLGLI